MKTSIVTRASALLALATTTSLAACSSPADAEPQQLTPVTVVLDWTPNTNHNGLYLALENGWYEEAGLDVTVIEPGETSGLQLMATGQADFAYSVAESLLPARAAGVDAASIATVIEDNTSSLLSLANDNITRPRDLEGKRYGSYGSQLETAIIDALVECDGGDPALVEHAPLVSDDFRIGLTEDHFDVAWVFDAWDTIRLGEIDSLDVNTIAFRDWTDCIPNWYTPILTTSASAIAESPDTVQAFIDATARGYEAAMDDPQQAADALLASAPELDRALVEASSTWLASRYATLPEVWGVQNALTWERFDTWLADGGMLDGDAGVDQAWTNDFFPGSS